MCCKEHLQGFVVPLEELQEIRGDAEVLGRYLLGVNFIHKEDPGGYRVLSSESLQQISLHIMVDHNHVLKCGLRSKMMEHKIP